MHAKSLRGTWVLAAVLALAPGVVRAQTYAPADPQLPIPIGSTRPEDGGLYTFAEYAMYRQTNILKQQVVAIRGFQTSDGTVPRAISATPGGLYTFFIDSTTVDAYLQARRLSGEVAYIPVANGTAASEDYGQFGANQFRPPSFFQPPTLFVPGFSLNGTNPRPLTRTIPIGGNLVEQTLVVLQNPDINQSTQLPPGTFVGSAALALDVKQLTGQDSYQPGFNIGIGWKFKDGSAVDVSWMYISEAQYRAGATLAPQYGAVGQDLENTFLYSPVYNFPPEYAGADNKIRAPFTTTPAISAQAVFGIWNGASIQTISFLQRTQQWELTYRTPIYETENYRLNGLVGPRFFWLWERFKWTTTSIGTNPDGTVASAPWYVGIYSTVTSNRMYGAHVGCQQEWYMGHGFAVMLETQLAAYMNSAKERAKYETGAKYYGFPENKRAKREWSLVPEAQANLGVMWYPTEFVQIYGCYEFMGFLNTLAARRPIDFDYSNLAPHWSHTARLFDGFRAGVAFTF